MPSKKTASIRSIHWTFESLETRQLMSANSLDPTHEIYRAQTFQVDEVLSMEDWSGPGLSALDAEASSLIGLTQSSREFRYSGAGYSVAVLDTGFNDKHPALAGRVIPGWDFVYDDNNPADDSGHGTHVAGIIASTDPSNPGIAPGAKIIPLKVLDSRGAGNFGDVEDALQWVIANRTKYNIAAINLSMGSGNYSVAPLTIFNDEIDSLIKSGVFIAVASGNSFASGGSQQGLAFPSVLSSIVSVGAVYDANVGSVSYASGARDITTAPDRIAAFTQRSKDLDILAPGARITSTSLRGSFETRSGTSMASPMVAGAAVLIRQALEANGHATEATPANILKVMKDTGKNIIDGDDENDNVTNTFLSFKRLDVLAALRSIKPASTTNPPAPIEPAIDPPSGISTPLSTTHQVGTFKDGFFRLKGEDGKIYSFRLGTTGDVAISGDWNSDGFTDLAAYRRGLWLLDTDGKLGWAKTDTSFNFGGKNDLPVVGDWNGDGKDEVGVFANGSWTLDTNGNRTIDSSDRKVAFGQAGDVPVTGDWNGDGKDEVGVFRNGTWLLDRNGNGQWDSADKTIAFGSAAGKPIVGNWSSSAGDEVGVYLAGEWNIDGTGKGVYAQSTSNSFGSAGEAPIAGRWIVGRQNLSKAAALSTLEFTSTPAIEAMDLWPGTTSTTAPWTSRPMLDGISMAPFARATHHERSSESKSDLDSSTSTRRSRLSTLFESRNEIAGRPSMMSVKE